ncbi:MAG: cyclase family protein [Paracoccaceae bacterium]|nr:cyclase family protein [Paracoccaceae bacterium]MDE2911595.1 cyclase family protein [Paracoccaceae bacterium]
MCHPVIMEYVKGKALSRRDLFRGSAAAGAAIVASAALTPRPVLAQEANRAIDLTYTLTHDFPTYFGEQQFFDEDVFTYAEHGFNLKMLRVNEHTGTHMDAPLHFTDGGTSIAEVQVEALVCPLAIVDLQEKADANPDAQVTPDDLKAWIAKHGPFPQGACVAQNSGWQKRMGSPRFRNADDEGKMHFPAFHVEAVTMLLEEADVAGIGVDTLSIDYGLSADFITHYTWLPANRWAVENMANLDQMPPTGATLVVGAPKHQGGTGGPCRLIALL